MREEVTIDQAFQRSIGEFGRGQRWLYCLVRARKLLHTSSPPACSAACARQWRHRLAVRLSQGEL